MHTRVRTSLAVSAVAAAAALAGVACGTEDGGASSGPAAGTASAADDRTRTGARPQDGGDVDGGGQAAGGGRAAASRLRTVATRLQAPWGVTFLPGTSDALVAERDTARIYRVSRSGRKRLVMRVPGVEPGDEGGLLGLAASPRYRTDRRVFAYFTAARDNRIVSFRLGGTRVRTVFRGIKKARFHNGGRLAFGPDGKLYAGVGDATTPSLSQDRRSPNGKILRLDPDGSVPRDNPFRGSPVYSLGHRNPQGLAFDRAGRLWGIEFGQNDVDEVNLIRPGRNYGWPLREGRGDTDGGRFTNPKVTWATSEASPSGAAVVGRSLYVAALRGERLWRVPLDGASVGRPQALFTGRYGRLRTAVAAPGGRLWFTTSNRDGRGSPAPTDDRIFELTP